MSYVECKHMKINITLICLMIELFWNENESSMSNILCFTVITIKSTDHAINERERHIPAVWHITTSSVHACYDTYTHSDTDWHWHCVSQLRSVSADHNPSWHDVSGQEKAKKEHY